MHDFALKITKLHNFSGDGTPDPLLAGWSVPSKTHNQHGLWHAPLPQVSPPTSLPRLENKCRLRNWDTDQVYESGAGEPDADERRD